MSSAGRVSSKSDDDTTGTACPTPDVDGVGLSNGEFVVLPKERIPIGQRWFQHNGPIEYMCTEYVQNTHKVTVLYGIHNRVLPEMGGTFK